MCQDYIYCVVIHNKLVWRRILAHEKQQISNTKRASFRKNHKKEHLRNMETQETEEYYIDEDASEEYLQPKETEPTNSPQQKQNRKARGSFADGLAAGLGIGSIACFAIIWLALYFSPLLPQSATYENLLAAFIYLLVPLLSAGLIALTAGIVREYYPKTKS